MLDQAQCKSAQQNHPTPISGNGSNINHVENVMLQGVPIVSLYIDGKERLCLAQISNTLLKSFSYNEIHNRRVALGITCVQCTPVQLEMLRRAGAMPISSRRCGMITKREAERLVKSFLEEMCPPKLPENFAFCVAHDCGWGCKGSFTPSRYNSSRAKCIKCDFCNLYFSPNKFIFHFHRAPDSKYRHPDAANFNSWRRHIHLDYPTDNDELSHAWEDVKAMFNGGSRKRLLSAACADKSSTGHGEAGRSVHSEMRDSAKRGRLAAHLHHSQDPSSNNKLPGMLPYPMFPVNGATTGGTMSAAMPLTPPYRALPMSTVPHPQPAESHLTNSVEHHKGGLTDLWKGKTPCYNPLGFLWAKNWGIGAAMGGMAGDGTNLFRGMDLAAIQQHQQQFQGEMAGRLSGRSIHSSNLENNIHEDIQAADPRRKHGSAFRPVRNLHPHLFLQQQQQYQLQQQQHHHQRALSCIPQMKPSGSIGVGGGEDMLWQPNLLSPSSVATHSSSSCSPTPSADLDPAHHSEDDINVTDIQEMQNNVIEHTDMSRSTERSSQAIVGREDHEQIKVKYFNIFKIVCKGQMLNRSLTIAS